ncbi:Uncharacterised protein [Vibrio cholerae]|uniref:Uncharacterized protein n=1 Tax=Vibrio cholerae TaxID=666 RepID=A0A655TJX4_VIBCL|nr:Uncharacterised protein [Vibrio cholerae]CSC42146.1 Uncharacterised protein [Vibrio cholerae]
MTRLIVSAPLTTVMRSGAPVPKVYWPGAITPTVLSPSCWLKPSDFTLPSKYTFSLIIFSSCLSSITTVV